MKNPKKTYHIVKRIIIDDSERPNSSLFKKIYNKKDYTELIFNSRKEIVDYIQNTYNVIIPDDFDFLEIPLENISKVICRDQQLNKDIIEATINKNEDLSSFLNLMRTAEYDMAKELEHQNNTHVAKYCDLLDEPIATEPIKQYFSFLTTGWKNKYCDLMYGENVVKLEYDNDMNYVGCSITKLPNA